MNAQIQGASNNKGKSLQVIRSFCVRMIGIVAPVSGGSVISLGLAKGVIIQGQLMLKLLQSELSLQRHLAFGPPAIKNCKLNPSPGMYELLKTSIQLKPADVKPYTSAGVPILVAVTVPTV
jgi:hypothetical protein